MRHDPASRPMAIRRLSSDLSAVPGEFDGTLQVVEKDGEKASDLLLGLAFVFGAVGAMLVFAAALSNFPFLALGAAFALPAALAFAISARRVRSVERRALAPAGMPRQRMNAVVAMRKAA